MHDREEIRLGPGLLSALSAEAPASAWADHLEAAGLRSLQVSPADAGAGTPAEGVAAVQAALAALRAAEAGAPVAAALPDAVWLLAAAVLLGIILFAPVMVALLGPSAIWGGIAFAAAVAVSAVRDRHRRAGEGQPEAARRHLRACLEALVARTFVATVDGVRLVSVPDLDAARALHAALALSDPEAPLLAALEAEILAVEARLEALRARPEAPWTDAGLRIDLARWTDAIDRLA